MGWYDDMYRQSFVGSYANARRLRSAIPTTEEIAANDGDSYYGYEGPVAGDAYDQALKANQQQAVAGGIVTGLTGATTLLSNAYKDAQIRDTTMQEGAIADLRNAGNYNYNNYDQLANDYARTDFSPNFNYQDIRGMTTGQQVGSVATSTLSGAATGLQIGGPWGALIGGVVGLGTGLAGVASGNAAAHVKQDSLNLQASLASDAARQNFEAAHERIGDNIHRHNAVNAVKYGGPISRQESITEFANRKLKNGIAQRERRPSNVQRIMKNGGCVYRVKVK